MVYRNIKLVDFNLDDRRYRFTMNPADRRLLRSVKEVGVLQPVVIVSRHSRPVLVDGWRRVEAALTCGLEELPALEVATTNDDLAVFLLAFFGNYGQRTFSLAEKSLAVRKFYEFRLQAVDLIERILPLLELPPERRMLDLMLEVSVLEKRFLEIMHRRDWKPVTAELWLDFSPAERTWLYPLLERLTHNQQREVIENFHSLQKKIGRSLAELAREGELAGLIDRLLKGESGAADCLLTAIRQANSPLLSRINKAIGEEIKRLNLRGVTLDYDRSLEKPTLCLTLEAGELKELRQTVKSLSGSLGSGGWHRLFELLHYEGE
ncbi:MAG: ParB N-terminal domain-containing protein [Candidatus Saccharicenans sp.]|nr:ParB N-terminal domain-containing protein [Candidatus Saccharicenans sp.]